MKERNEFKNALKDVSDAMEEMFPKEAPKKNKKKWVWVLIVIGILLSLVVAVLIHDGRI